MSDLNPNKNVKFLKGGGQMGQLIRSKDWSNSTLGNIETWSPSLRTTLSIILNSKFPMFLFWGPEFLCFYNDAYRPSLGNDGKHPHILGETAKESWHETWHLIEPVLENILAGGESTLDEDQVFISNINDKLESGYWTYCYSSVENDLGEVAGVFVTCNETTKKVEAFEKLRQNEKKLNFTIEATNLGIWNFNPETQIFKGNSRLKQWFGVDKNEDITVETAINRLVENDRQKTRDAMFAAIKTGSDGVYEVEHTVLNPLTNQEYILLSKGKAIFDEDNSFVEMSGTVQDITEQVLARRELEESEEQLRFALDGGNLGYFNSYPKQDIIICSDKTKEFFGVPLEAKINLELYKNVIHPEDAKQELFKLQKALEYGGDSLYTNEYRTAYTNKWLSVKGKISSDKKNKTIRISGIIQDITESKLAEKLLLDSEHRFKTMIYTSPSLISILKGENFIVDIANDAILEAWGKGKDSIGKPLLVIMPELVKQGFHEILTNVYQTGIPFRGFEMPVNIKKDGVLGLFYFTFVFQAQRDVNGKIESIAILSTDVTQQAELNKKVQENEKLLRETKEQLELTFSNVPASIFLYNNRQEILFANERAANMLGYSTINELLSNKYFDVLMTKGMSDFNVLNENNEFFFVENLPTYSTLKSKKQGEMVFSMQKKSGGPKIWYLNKSAPIFDAEGNVSMVLTTSTDITVQKLAEETIRDSESRFRLLTDNAPMWVWITNIEVDVLYANHELLKHVGLNHYAEFTGKVWLEVVYPDDIIVVMDSFKKSVAEESAFDFEARVLNAQTKVYEWYYLKGIPRYENEEFIGFIGTGFNIHQQKTQLFALEESEQRFKYLVETLPQMVLVMDEARNIEYVTNKWEKYTGIETGGKLKTWQQIIHPEDLEYANSVWLASLSSGNLYKFDLRLRSKEGEYRWFTVNGEPVFDAKNKIIKWVSAFTDVHSEKSFSQELEKQVTERTNELLISNELMLQKNDLLRISENFNRSLTDISPNIVYIQDILEDKPFFLNSTYLTFTGYHWQQVKLLGDGFMREVIHPDDYDFMLETIEKIKVSKPGEIFEAKTQIKNDKGVWVPFLNRLTAFKRDNNQNVVQVIGVAIDISELKGAEKILEQKNEELLKMNKELESFAYVSSHDLQEPLRKIQTFTSRIMEKEYDNLSENGKNYLNRMRLAAERMQQLINDLLAYSRTKVQERKFESTDLSLIVREVEDDLKDELIKQNGRIEIMDSFKANVIPFQFRQLIYNLVSNSIKFAKMNEDLLIKFKFEIINGFEQKSGRLMTDKTYCHISITDNGIGFDPSYKDRIFEIFQRLHGREEYTGTGIGLAIVKKIVDNHNGIIDANGALGEGATFNIYIPVE